MSLLLKFAPRGWAYQNVVNCVQIESKSLDGFDLEHDNLTPQVFDKVAHDLEWVHGHKSLFKLFAAIIIPNTAKAKQTTAHNQTMVNEAQIVCALERYRLAQGDYPGTLDALVPQFIETIAARHHRRQTAHLSAIGPAFTKHRRGKWEIPALLHRLE